MTKTALTSFELMHLKNLLDRYINSKEKEETYLNAIKQVLSDHWFMDAIGIENPKVFIQKFERADQDFIERIKNKIDGVKYTEHQMACLKDIVRDSLDKNIYRKSFLSHYLAFKNIEVIQSLPPIVLDAHNADLKLLKSIRGKSKNVTSRN